MKRTIAALILSLPALAHAQSATALCKELEGHIDAELRIIALASSMTTTEESAARMTNHLAAQTKGWIAIRALMDQMRDSKCRPISYSLASEPYGLPAAQCSYAIVAKFAPAERIEACDKSKWKKSP